MLYLTAREPEKFPKQSFRYLKRIRYCIADSTLCVDCYQLIHLILFGFSQDLRAEDVDISSSTLLHVKSIYVLCRDCKRTTLLLWDFLIVLHSQMLFNSLFHWLQLEA